MPETTSDFDVTWLNRKHLVDVLAIEAESSPLPWTEGEFLESLKQRNIIGKVLSSCAPGDVPRVVGFIIYALNGSSIEILNCAVAPEYRRYGIARRFIDELKSKMDQQRRRVIVARVRESNDAGIAFYVANGFRAVKVERGFYERLGEDAYVFEFVRGIETPTGRGARHGAAA